MKILKTDTKGVQDNITGMVIQEGSHLMRANFLCFSYLLKYRKISFVTQVRAATELL